MQFLVSATVFFEMAKYFFLAKVLAKVHVDMSKFAYVFIVDYDLLCMFHFVKTIG